MYLILPSGKVYKHKGKFYAIQRQVDTRTGTLQVAATFPNPENLLKPGQFIRLRAETFMRKDALLVPQRAVTELQSIYQVAVVGDDSKVQIRTVEVGERVGTQWVITKGLQRARPGSKVEPRRMVVAEPEAGPAKAVETKAPE